SVYLFFRFMLPLPPSFTLFPYTTLFRSLFGVDSDESRDGLGERSDSIMILSVNPNNDKTVMISIPRDTRTEIVGNDSVEKINHRSEEHTSELQSRFDLVCRLLLEKKKKE